MADIETFIQEARAKGLADKTIRAALAAQGWDDSLIDAALAGLLVPSAHASTAIPPHHPTLSPLMAALHHILLWFFAGSSAVTIAGVVASLSGTNVSATALASMIAITIITFLPYAVLFLIYLRKTRHIADLVPGKIWSIITICLHSVGAMIAAIALVISLITASTSTVIISALLIIVLDLIIVLTYCFAAFVHPGQLRTIIIFSYLPALFILFGTLCSMSLLQLGPARHDEQVRKDLATTVQQIYSYTQTHDRLPANISDINAPASVRYSVITSTSYEVCATFQTASQYSGYDGIQPVQLQTDSYTYESQFTTPAKGERCFSFSSGVLSRNPAR